MFNKNLVFVASYTAIFLFGVGLITLGSVAPVLKEKFNLSDIAAGTLFSILPLGILVGSLLFGPISDRYGYRIMLSVSCFCMFAGFEGIAYAGSISSLRIFVFLFGLGGGAINGGTSAVVADVSDRKGKDLSLLSVFYGLGALSMPFLSGILKNIFSFEQIIAAVGWATLLAGFFFLVIRFPPPKQGQGLVRQGIGLFKNSTIIAIAFFLFCQSSFEGIINNWTTSYLTEHLLIAQNKALYALAAYLAGMTLMRLLIGTVLSKFSHQQLVPASLAIVFAGCLILSTTGSFGMAVAGLCMIGAGLGGGFPIMLGIVGNRFPSLSGTAFSFVLVTALVGNMLVNYFMGVIAQAYGIRHLVTFSFAELIVMILLYILVAKKLKK